MLRPEKKLFCVGKTWSKISPAFIHIKNIIYSDGIFFLNYKKSKTPLKLYLPQILSNVFFYKYFVNLTTKNLLGIYKRAEKNVENKEPEIALILYTPCSNPLHSAEF